MASKADLIEKANWLRRDAERLRRENLPAYKMRIYEMRGALFAEKMPEEDVRDLLPDSLLDALPACRLRPLADHVVIRPAAAKAETEGGIVIPDSAKEVPMRGEVLAVGPGRIEPGVGTVLPAVTIGDDVLFGRYAGVEVQLDGEDVRIMREEDILGVLAPEATNG